MKVEKCEICGATEGLMRARTEEGRITYICESCYNRHCEGYELLPRG